MSSRKRFEKEMRANAKQAIAHMGREGRYIEGLMTAVEAVKEICVELWAELQETLKDAFCEAVGFFTMMQPDTETGDVQYQTLSDKDGRKLIPIFTSGEKHVAAAEVLGIEEVIQSKPCAVMHFLEITDMITEFKKTDPGIYGIILNPGSTTVAVMSLLEMQDNCNRYGEVRVGLSPEERRQMSVFPWENEDYILQKGR